MPANIIEYVTHSVCYSARDEAYLSKKFKISEETAAVDEIQTPPASQSTSLDLIPRRGSTPLACRWFGFNKTDVVQKTAICFVRNRLQYCTQKSGSNIIKICKISSSYRQNHRRKFLSIWHTPNAERSWTRVCLSALLTFSIKATACSPTELMKILSNLWVQLERRSLNIVVFLQWRFGGRLKWFADDINPRSQCSKSFFMVKTQKIQLKVATILHP